MVCTRLTWFQLTWSRMNSECLHLCNPSPSDSPDWFGDQQPLDAMNGYYLWTKLLSLTTTTTKQDAMNDYYLLNLTTATTTYIHNALLWMAQCMGKIGHFCSRGLFASVVMNTTEHYPRIRKSIRILPHFKISANFVYKTKTNCWHDSSRPFLVLF